MNEAANREWNAPAGEKIRPELVRATDMAAGVIVARQTNGPMEDLSCRRLVYVGLDGEWVEDEYKVVMIGIKIEAVGTGGHPWSSVHRRHDGVCFLLQGRPARFGRVEPDGIESQWLVFLLTMREVDLCTRNMSDDSRPACVASVGVDDETFDIDRVHQLHTCRTSGLAGTRWRDAGSIGRVRVLYERRHASCAFAHVYTRAP